MKKVILIMAAATALVAGESDLRQYVITPEKFAKTGCAHGYYSHVSFGFHFDSRVDKKVRVDNGKVICTETKEHRDRRMDPVQVALRKAARERELHPTRSMRIGTCNMDHPRKWCEEHIK